MELTLIREKEIAGYKIKTYTYKSFVIRAEKDQKSGLVTITGEDPKKLFDITTVQDHEPVLIVSSTILHGQDDVEEYSESFADAKEVLDLISEHWEELI